MATNMSGPVTPDDEQQPDPSLQAVIINSLVAAARESFEADDTDDDFDEDKLRADAFTQWLSRRIALDVETHLAGEVTG
jgi:hypothetical protein